MIMAVDLSESKLNFSEIAQKLDALGKNNAVEIRIQLQSIFDSMHQVSTMDDSI